MANAARSQEFLKKARECYFHPPASFRRNRQIELVFLLSSHGSPFVFWQYS
jgi:hypothetical protein